MNSLVLQRFARTNLLGIDFDLRLDIADEPCFEALELGRLFEYKDSHKCRALVRRLIADGRLSCTVNHRGRPQNSADNSTRDETDPPVADVYSVEVIEPHGVRLGTTEQLWLTERACLLVATASETDRAWQVRTALVDFFLACRRERTNASSISPSIVHDIEKTRAEVRGMLDEVRTIRSEVVQALDIDARVRRLETRPARQPSPPKQTLMQPETNALEASVDALLETLSGDEEISIPDIAAKLGLELDDSLMRKLGVVIARAGWTPTRRVRVGKGQRRMYRIEVREHFEALAAAVVPVLAEHPEGLTTAELLELGRPAIDAARDRRTLVNPLGKELSALMAAGYPIERGWGHGHIARWRRRDG